MHSDRCELVDLQCFAIFELYAKYGKRPFLFKDLKVNPILRRLSVKISGTGPFVPIL